MWPWKKSTLRRKDSHGHEVDPNFISGFAFTGDVQFNGADIGPLSGEVTLVNPPLNLFESE
ncbi:MAG: hypothetical protein Kow0060_08620 [Methylohalobius crimeensis]